MRRLQVYVPGLLGMYSTARWTQTNLVSSFIIPLVVAFSHLYFLSSIYQQRAYRVYHPPPQVYSIHIPSYSPPSLSHIPFPLPLFPFEVEVPCRFLCLQPLSLLNELHALIEGHL